MEEDGAEDGPLGRPAGDMYNEREFILNDPVVCLRGTSGVMDLALLPQGIEGIEGLECMYQRSVSGGAAAPSVGTVKIATIVKALTVGSVKLEEGSWFMCRPDEGSPEMWFGKVKKIIHHEGGDGLKRPVIMAEWYAGESEPCPVLRCPIVNEIPYKNHPDGPWFQPVGVLGWHCFGLPHPTKKRRIVMLARHWNVLRHFPNIPCF